MPGSSQVWRVVDIVGEMFLSIDILNANGFKSIVDLRDNVLRIGEKKLNFCMAEIVRKGNRLIKRVTLAKEEVNRCGEEEHLISHNP